MTMARKILIAVAALVVLLIGASVYISRQPDSFSVERSAIVAAPPYRLFAAVNDLKAWDAWSPWKDLDPNAAMTVSTPSAGRGATSTWSGNDKVGEGRLTIVESRPDERVDIDQAFVRPFEGKARHSFTFAPAGEGTRVTWRMDGTNDFVGKALCLVMDMDKTVGKDFERGLANMKALAER
jgi:polyketide cyclase/dehydrase/lipid transport protein